MVPGAAVFPPFSPEVTADVVFVDAAVAVTDFVLVVAPAAVRGEPIPIPKES